MNVPSEPEKTFNTVEEEVSLDTSTGTSQERILPLLILSDEELKTTLSAFGLSSEEPAKLLGEGRIASNTLVKTGEQGDVIVRVYPESYSRSKIQFEVEALAFAAEGGIAVPAPIALQGRPEQYILERDGKLIFTYSSLPGETVEQNEISAQIASEAGELLASFLETSGRFEPRSVVIEGDLGFIQGLLRTLKETNGEFAALEVGGEMDEVILDAELHKFLASSPQGIVHADYFFENILRENNKTVGVLDFGDAYYGALLNDVVIGAMEFAVDSNENWNLEYFEKFLEPLKGFVAESGASASICRKLLAANCVRFAVYTVPFTQAEAEPTEDNPYIKRFQAINGSELGQKIEGLFEKLLNK